MPPAKGKQAVSRKHMHLLLLSLHLLEHSQHHIAVVVHLLGKVGLVHAKVIEKLLKQPLREPYAASHLCS